MKVQEIEIDYSIIPEAVEHVDELSDRTTTKYPDNIEKSQATDNGVDLFIERECEVEIIQDETENVGLNKPLCDIGPIEKDICEQNNSQNKIAILDHQNNVLHEKWKNKDVTFLKNYLQNVDRLKTLTINELNVIASVMKLTDFKNPMTKIQKLNKLSLALHLKKIPVFYKTFESLQKIALESLLQTKQSCMSATKETLNAIFAVLVHPQRERKWMDDSTVKVENIIGIPARIKWFSYPCLSKKRKQLEPKCLDGEHMFVNARVKVCKDGMLGLSKKAWVDVAERYPDIISPSLVVDLIDKQSAANAKRTFCLEVETTMIKLGYVKEAEFCNIFRNWYDAEDTAGIPSLERALKRLALRDYMLSNVDFSQYPPYGSHIRGMPRTMYEGLLQSIDTHIQLYAICKEGTYNQPAVSSLVNETFFGEMADMKQTKLGCPKAISVPRLMSVVTELMHYRHNPENR